MNYPPSPREVVKYFGQLTQCFYNEEYTQEELEELALQIQKLYDKELVENKTQDQYLQDLRWDIDNMKDQEIVVSSYSPASSTDVTYFHRMALSGPGCTASLPCVKAQHWEGWTRFFFSARMMRDTGKFMGGSRQTTARKGKQRMKDDVIILAIESSCDETAASVVKNGREVLSNVIYSQIALHTEYGGVVPEIASRKHIEKINQVIEQALEDAGMQLSDLTAIAVTYGPGLVGALLVGVSAAKAISFATGLPLIGVHHIEGHISANYIENKDLEPPFLCLVVSGGHSHLVVVKDYGEYEIIGRTRDDAAGEAFDKVARAIGLGYPGGPKIDRVAKEGNPNAIHFPRAKVGDAEYDFSFSGLKSAVLNYLNSCQMKGEEICVPDVAASFQKAVVDVLVEHSMDAVKRYGYSRFAIAGGVASNSALRAAFEEACKARKIEFYHPSPVYCTDNAAMIGAAAYYEYVKGVRHGYDLNAVPNLKLGERI